MFSSACMQVRVACSNTTDQSMLSYCVGSTIDRENAANATRHARASAPVAVRSDSILNARSTVAYKLYLRVCRQRQASASQTVVVFTKTDVSQSRRCQTVDVE